MNENQIDEYTKCHAAYLVFILNMSYVKVCLYYTHVYIYIYRYIFLYENDAELGDDQ